MPFAPPAEHTRSTGPAESGTGAAHRVEEVDPALADEMPTEMPLRSEPDPAVVTNTEADATPVIRPLLLQRQIEPTISAVTPMSPGRISAGRAAVRAQVLAGDLPEAPSASARSAPMHGSGGRSEQVVQGPGAR